MSSLPVASFTNPNTDGPSHPPRLPTALIMAMPPAAAVPVSRALGSDQKVGKGLLAHHREAQRDHRDDRMADADEDAGRQPTGSNQGGTGHVPGPLAVMSEWQPQEIIATNANR